MTTISGTAQAALDAIKDAMATRGLMASDGQFAVYRDIYQDDGDGRDFADYHGTLRHRDRVPQKIAESPREAAELLDAIRGSGTLGGVRYGRVAFRPMVMVQRGIVVTYRSGRAADEIALVKITRRGYAVEAETEGQTA